MPQHQFDAKDHLEKCKAHLEFNMWASHIQVLYGGNCTLPETTWLISSVIRRKQIKFENHTFIAIGKSSAYSVNILSHTPFFSYSLQATSKRISTLNMYTCYSSKPDLWTKELFMVVNVEKLSVSNQRVRTHYGGKHIWTWWQELRLNDDSTILIIISIKYL